MFWKINWAQNVGAHKNNSVHKGLITKDVGERKFHPTDCQISPSVRVKVVEKLRIDVYMGEKGQLPYVNLLYSFLSHVLCSEFIREVFALINLLKPSGQFTFHYV
jgi:hypothetical protein